MLELQEKISQLQKDMFKRMLGLNELPDLLLERYFLLKKMFDKVDARITAGDMIRMAIDCGLNPETMRFETMPETFTSSNIGVTEMEEVSVPVEDKEEVTEETQEETQDEIQEETQEEMQEETQEEERKIIPNGTHVSAFYNGEIIRGAITGFNEDYGNMVYTVNIGKGEDIEINEEDIEVD